MNFKQYLEHTIFSIISEIADREGSEVYVIGGFVRDLLLSGTTQTEKDIDVVVVGSGIRLAASVKKAIGKDIPLTRFKNFGTAMLKWGNMEVEFVGARKESYRETSRKPLVEDGTLEDDLKRRDFTINALGLSLNKSTFGDLLDPFNGLKDLEKKRIKTPLDPDRTFSDDPLRMLRGIRFATRLGFTIEPSTFEAIRKNRDRIRIVSQERITDELNKIMLTDRPSEGFLLLDRTGLLEYILPELNEMKGVDEKEGQGHKDNFYHTLQVLDNVSASSADLWLRWAALLHDVAKPRTKRFEKDSGWTFHGHEFIGSKMVPGIFRRLKLPLHDRMKYVQKLVRLHLRPIVLSQETVTDSAVRRLIFDAGKDLEDLMTLCEADITSKNERTVKRHLRNFRLVRNKMRDLEEKDSIRNFQPPVSGDEIQEVFGISPSREVGIIKNAIKEAILEGEIKNNHPEAFRLMLIKGAELGLSPVKEYPEIGNTDRERPGDDH